MQHLIRQFDLIPNDVLNEKITIIGAGAVGSNVSVTLAKMGLTNQEVWDFDEVSIENMSSQGYRFKDIGRPKVEALRDIVKDYSNQDVSIRNERFERQQLTGIVISAVDSMAVRKLIWARIKNSPVVKYLIDPRMSIEYGVMYAMNPCDEKDQTSYEKTLFDDADSVQEPCTAKAVMYTSNLISGLVAKTVKDIITNNPYPRNVIYNIGADHLQVWTNKERAHVT